MWGQMLHYHSNIYQIGKHIKIPYALIGWVFMTGAIKLIIHINYPKSGCITFNYCSKWNYDVYR